MKKNRKRGNKDKNVIPLGDLIPRRDPRGGSGGSGRAIFGESPIPADAEGRPSLERKPPKKR
jgi:hypothetical protein